MNQIPSAFASIAAQARDLLISRARAHLADVPAQPALIAGLRRPQEQFFIISPPLMGFALALEDRDDTAVVHALGQFSDFYVHEGARLDTYGPALDAFTAEHAHLGAPAQDALGDALRALCAAHWAELMRQADSYMDGLDADGAHRADPPAGVTAAALADGLAAGYPAV